MVEVNERALVKHLRYKIEILEKEKAYSTSEFFIKIRESNIMLIKELIYWLEKGRWRQTYDD